MAVSPSTQRRLRRRNPFARFSSTPLAVDSVALIVTSALSAATGIAFWTLAARLIPPHELGIETAVLSLMTTAGAVAASGPGNAITAMIPASDAAGRRQRLLEAITIVGVGALVTGAVAGVVGALTVGEASARTTVVIALGSVVLAFFTFKDTVLTALSAARRLPLLNLGVSVLKAAALPIALLVALPMSAVTASLVAATIGIALVAWMAPPLVGHNLAPVGMVREHKRSALLVFSLRDGTASLVSMGVLLAAPFLTTWLAGPVQGAILALMLPIAQSLDFVSIGAAMALTKHLATAREPRQVIVRVWWVSQAAVIAVALGLIVTAPVLFELFGDGYDHQTLWLTLAVLCLASILRVSFVVWAAVLRASLATRALLVTNFATSVITVPFLVISIIAWGAVGAAVGACVGSLVAGLAGLIGLTRGKHALRVQEGSA
ncbi:oligosaccharide flippase family protein [Gordonia sp. NPDC003585]|uniref:lipopolysaccharide biosynthesis protein n=1 Tax=Gordonia sp. NPDC003585 TaxID=3154275 RepID=UPI0033BD9982